MCNLPYCVVFPFSFLTEPWWLKSLSCCNSSCVALHGSSCLRQVWRQSRPIRWESGDRAQEAVCSVGWEGVEQDPTGPIEEQEERLGLHCCCPWLAKRVLWNGIEVVFWAVFLGGSFGYVNELGISLTGLFCCLCHCWSASRDKSSDISLSI